MLNKFIKNKYIILATLVLIVLISPLLYMFTGAHMAADDFVYGSNAHVVYENTGSFFKVIKEAINSTKWWYNNWQGSFVSVFFMALQPGVFSLATYRIILCLMFLLGIASIILLGSLVNKFYIKMPNKYMALIICSIIFIWTQYLPSVFEGYFWYNSAVYYSFTFYLTLITVSLIMLFHNTKSKLKRVTYYILLVISLIMIAGSNYPMALTFSLALALYVLIAFINKYTLKWYSLTLFIVFISIFIINISAPGNALRGGHYVRDQS